MSTTDLLDFEDPAPSKWWHQLIDLLEAIPIYKKVITVLLLSLMDTFILAYKASKTTDTSEFLQVWVGLLIMLLFPGYLLHLCLNLWAFLSYKISNKTLKINHLTSSSTIFLLSILGTLILIILALFVD